jgi:MFS family permease
VSALDRSGFASLRHRNFRLYLLGQSISQAGTWMQTVAMGWLVLKLTDSGGLLGMVTAAQFVPALLLGPYAGALADRRSRWRILQTAQILAGVCSAVLAVLVSTDLIQVWSLFVLAVAIGTVNAFDTPVRSSFVYEMVGPEDITGAVGVGSTSNNVARIIGPAVAGALIAGLGVASCFYVNSASYLVCTVTFLLMRRHEFEPATVAAGRSGNVREGLRVVWRDPRLRTPLLMAVVIGALAYENQISLPLLARFTFEASAGSYGVMSSAMGVGAVLGGVLIARSGQANHRRLGYAALSLGAAMLLASAMPSLSLMVAALVVVGAGSVAFVTMTSATLQLTAPTEMRGRVLALYVTALIGTTPVGGPVIGWIGEVLGPRATYVAGGLACVVTAAVGWRSLTRSHELSVTATDATAIEELAVREAEGIEADAASAMPTNPDAQSIDGRRAPAASATAEVAEPEVGPGSRPPG